MKAVIFDETLKYVEDYEKPTPEKGEALIKVTYGGVCNTDKEITKGYMGYKGILGHEFTGVVEEINDEDKTFLGKRVVGEINLGCKNCEWCAKDLERHCPNRSTLGILTKDGCFAEYVTLPLSNLIEIPENVPDEQAVFVEPLAAGLEILEQMHIQPCQKVMVLGDGKLGLLTALALNACGLDVLIVGKHQNKLDIAKNQGVKTQLLSKFEQAPKFDVVVEATGSITGFETSVNCVKPRGTLVLKSTIAASKELNLAPIVINEITILGSRCGRFEPAMRLIASGKIDFSQMISKIYPIEQAIKAFDANNEKDTIKILLKIG